MVCFPLIRLSRSVIVWPGSIDVAHEEWWLTNATRLDRSERLLGEDLILFATVLPSFVTCEDVVTVRAAHRAGGERDPAQFGGGGALLLAVVAVDRQARPERSVRPSRRRGLPLTGHRCAVKARAVAQTGPARSAER
ncbi:hypothetical protein MOPEL_013_00230 [Mobilicoccus pelagius NBRC 104925]|uniref:Uncharacterized protein n=1 Tax=Mobilicoccus pelagius NBRC 104925 TaxID=1089455 RepID=H5UP24_9MICO|nr:hypothetical protein MOPEL_013_00230 [Mobilicoccus pelagius NBRC 104925]